MHQIKNRKVYLCLIVILLLLFTVSCSSLPAVSAGSSADVTAASLPLEGSTDSSALTLETTADILQSAKVTAGEEPTPAEEIPSGNQYNMALTLDIENHSIGGTETVIVQNNSGDTWNELCFRDYPSLFTADGQSGYDSNGSISDISGMRDLTKDSSLTFARDAEDVSVVYVSLSVPLKAGESRKIQFDFTAYVPALKSRYGYSESVYNLANFYPILAVYENGGWNTEKYFLWGECFYSIVSDYQVTLTVPSGYTMISSGLCAMSASTDEETTWSISAADVRDFAVVTGLGFDVTSKSVDGVRVNSYYLNGDKSQGEASLDAATAALAVFNETFGDYPYPELDIVETYLDSGGMEYPAIVMIRESLSDSTDKGSYLKIVVAHEVAHQWFYGMVGDNQYREAWLDESFASYCELVYMETFTDRKDIQYEVDNLEASLESEGIPQTKEDYYINRSYDEFESDTAYTYTVYMRGEVFLYRLREAMGTDAFNTAMKEYVAEYTFQVASTDDFQAVINKYAKDNPDVQALLAKYIKEDS